MTYMWKFEEKIQSTMPESYQQNYLEFLMIRKYIFELKKKVNEPERKNLMIHPRILPLIDF